MADDQRHFNKVAVNCIVEEASEQQKNIERGKYASTKSY